MFDSMFSPATLLEGVVLLCLFILIVLNAKSVYSIGPTQVGLVRKRFGAKLPGDNPIAFKGEAGYQAELLMPGLRFKFCGIYAVAKHPWVQVPAGQIGVVIAQVGAPTPIATLDLRIDYMRAAEPGLDIFARAHCYKLTRSIAFVRAAAYDRDHEDPVATAQAAFMLTGPAEPVS